MRRDTDGGRLAYADLLRILATLGVIVLHLTGGWVEQLTPGTGTSTVFHLYNGLLHWCVPVFVMLSGMFLLDPKRDLGPGRLFRHLARIAVALAVWGAIYAVVTPWLSGETLSLDAVKTALLEVLRAKTHYHLWFLYMIFGLYLITPILRAFVKGASRGDFHYFFLLYGFFILVLPLLLRLRPSDVIQRYVWLMYFTNTAFKFAGFYVAGYYLKTFELNRFAQFVIYALGILGGIVTVGGTAFLQQAGESSLVLYEYTTPNIAAMAVAVFVLFRSLTGLNCVLARSKLLGGVGCLTFGVYLVHDLFLQLLSHFQITALSFMPVLSVPILTAVVFLCSLIPAWLLSKIPLIGKFIT